MFQKIILLVACIVFMRSFAFTQDDIVEGFQSQLETYFEAEETDLLPIIEYLTHLSKNPLDLNHCSYEDLMHLEILSQLQVEQILKHRKVLGDFLDTHELQAVSGLDLQTISLLSQVVTVESKIRWTPINFKNLISLGKSDLLIRAKTFIEKEQDYVSNEGKKPNFSGNNHQYLFRYKYNFDNRIIFNYLGEKDPGETLIKRHIVPVPDFNSGYLAILGPCKYVDQLIIGDFNIHLGQGLISNASYGGGKSASVMQISKLAKSIRSYGSVNENGFMRGMAVSGKAKIIHYTAFCSFRFLDSRLDTMYETDITIGSQSLTGFHRTEEELADKQNTHLLSFGGKAGIHAKAIRISFNFTGNRYEFGLTKPEELYRKFDYTQQTVFHSGIDYHVRWKNLLFSGETALMNLSSMANVHMVQLSLAKDLDLALLYRNYPSGYQTIFGEGFGESGGASNEHGIYASGVFRLARNIRLEAYIDLWRYDWLKYLVDRPSQGYEYFFKAEYTLRKKMQLYFQYKSELKQNNFSDAASSVPEIADVIKTSYRAHIAYKLSPTIELRNRVEWTISSKGETSHGLLIFQDVIFKPLQFPVSFTGRLAYFDIENWDSRIYSYENDLLYAFSIPVYYRSGYRIYGNIRYKPFKNMVVEARMARSYYPFEVLSEYGEVNHKTEIKIQLKYSF
ncbi:MAG TPA: helix-hairpin-helix domain-containing protein [Saprospiraceae bacterium]|nr:helix-hairpin-helix domain-containing protein [Saprospiraceae bacterium]